MNELIQDYLPRMRSSADGLVWAAGQIPRGRSRVIPLPSLGEWPAARIVFQVMWEEREAILPLLRGWHDDDGVIDIPDEAQAELAWRANQLELPQAVAGFQQARQDVLGLLAGLTDDALWSAQRNTPWGQVSLAWLVGRAYQQTLAYTVRLLDMALYWDLLLEAQKQARLAQAESDNDND